jgi:hypothetical protein
MYPHVRHVAETLSNGGGFQIDIRGGLGHGRHTFISDSDPMGRLSVMGVLA